ncbi:MAG: hypothetical protein AAF280_02940 [Pseudomonadota bacterium]
MPKYSRTWHDIKNSRTILDETEATAFPTINAVCNREFKPGRLSIGLVLPLETYAVGDTPIWHGLCCRISPDKGPI